jgi:lysyl-tRNA synthetase class 2
LSFRPSASLDSLRQRARLLAEARDFFKVRGVLEVETPILCQAGVVDEHLEPIRAEYHAHRGAEAKAHYLMTSPEHSMKRLLAAGSGPIYQITRAFRDGERGRLHNPEFTILEWYRPGFDHVALMDEVEALLRRLLHKQEPEGPDEAAPPFARVTYREACLNVLGLNPHRVSPADLSRIAGLEGVPPPPNFDDSDRDEWLNLLLMARVEETLGFERPAFLMDYPASQAALAKVRDGDPPVAERFELYVRGMEIANGYHELLDPREQERRFVAANEKRVAAGKSQLPLDPLLIAALEAGIPQCAGVAVGIDRVVMLALGLETIDEVQAFPIERA